MNVLTKLALGMMGQLRPKPAKGDSATSIALPPSTKSGGHGCIYIQSIFKCLDHLEHF